MLSDEEEDGKNDKILQEERQGKMLLHTEFSLLDLLEHEEGVIHHHGMFSVTMKIFPKIIRHNVGLCFFLG